MKGRIVFDKKSCRAMAKPLESLRKGLQALQKQIQAWKSQIKGDLKAGKKIPAIDEEWIDGTGNLVDEECVVQNLETASDYERELQRMDTKNQGIVEKLQILGAGRWN